LSVKKIDFILSVQFTLNIIQVDKLSCTLSDYFRFKISKILEEFLSNKFNPSNFFIAGLGSFSTKEMTFASDIDLIFVVNKLDAKGYLQKEFQNILLKFKNDFNPYNVDCRLRPEGKSSLLVWELGSYSNYMKERARIWELQAFTKLSFIYGSKSLYAQFQKSLTERVRKEDKKNIKKEMLEMRRKIYPKSIGFSTYSFNIKKSRGGLTDIEFVLQYLILCNPDLYNKSFGNNTLKNISNLLKGNNKLKDLEKLKENFYFLKKIELLNQNIFNNTLPNLQQDDKKFMIFALRLELKKKEEFLKRIKSIALYNQNLFDKYLGEN